MFNRLLFTFATVTCLTGVYAGYAVVTRPLVVVPELPETSVDLSHHPVSRLPIENVRVAELFLPEQGWATQSPYMARSGQAFIYTQSVDHQMGDARVRFTPFAMIWLQKDDEGNESAVTLVSDSALLKFASVFDHSKPDPGRIVGAVLDGEVQIKGPDGLAVGGKQFVFDESAPSLVSTNPVEFKYGPHQGRGRSLYVKLIPAEGPPGRDRPHVFGVRTIRVASGTDPLTRKFEPVQLDVRMPQQGQQKLVKVRCSGDMEYDVSRHTAVFSQSVVASSKTAGNGYDSLECDKLWLQFEPARTNVPEQFGKHDLQDKSPQAFQKIETDLAFRSLTAEGQLVKVVSTQNSLRATMKRLVYDIVDRRLELSDPRDVYVAQKSSVLRVPEIEVQLTEANAVKEVICRGTGRLEMTRPESNDLAFVATWNRQLRKSTDATNGLDLIELQQRASFRQPGQQTGLGAELIRLWLEPLSVNLNAGGDASSEPPPASEPQPKRLVAENEVALVSPQLLARTSSLNVQFESEPVKSPALGQFQRERLQLVVLEEPLEHQTERKPIIADAAPAVGAKQRLIQPASHSDRGSLGPPIPIPLSADSEPVGRSSLSKGAMSTEPLEVTADNISVRMRLTVSKTPPELAEVETQGHVKVVQRHQNGESPLTAEGDRLTLQNRGESKEVVHLFGQPAHLRDRGLHVEGREVHLDREGNRVWVKGSGLLQLPVPPGTALESLGQATKDPDLDVWWQESMEFDGKVAKFIGKVRAELGLSRMCCELMDVGLSSRLSFSQPNLEQQPELGTVHCREDVTFENAAYQGNTMIRVQRGRVAEFKIERLKGSTFAQGPGQILVWQRGNGPQVPGGSRDVIQANRPINAVSALWNFTRVDFKGVMTGNIDLQLSTFHGSVLIVHGPVDRPNDTIDSDHLTPQAGSMRCDKLQFAYRSKGPNQPTDYQQLVGWGNAQIEGRGFYANADEISFDGSKDLYMLRAHGNQSAMIAQDTENGRRNEASGRRIEFIPKTQTVKVDWATGASGSGP